MEPRTAGWARSATAAHQLVAALAVGVPLVDMPRLVLASSLAHDPGPATADTSVPVIVTYELARQRDAARIAAKDPRGFWISQIMARIEDAKRTTPMALQRATTVQVGFTISRDGHVIARSVRASSGLAAIDAAALAVVDRAAPFPPMPSALQANGLSFVLPLRFR